MIRNFWLGIGAFILPAMVMSSHAADITTPIYKAVPNTSENGWYVWLEGSYQRLRLPGYGIGFKKVPNNGTGVDGTPFDSFDARADGSGVAGGIGYLLPNAPTSPLFGSDLRLEMFGSYVRASGTQQSGVVVTAPGAGPGINIQMLSGLTGTTSLPCNGGFTCTSTASLSTDYVAWQISGRVKSDYRFGVATLTPSLGIIGGNAHNNQTFAQTIATTFGIFPTSTYDATTSLKWTDLGGQIGLEGKVAVHPWVTLGLQGNIGWVDRWTNLSGNDVFTGHFGLPTAPVFRSGVEPAATTTAFLANAEANINIKPSKSWVVRLFAGLNYDSKVPGVSSPTYTGAITAPTSVTSAGITYVNETSYYAGGGLILQFFDGVVAKN